MASIEPVIKKPLRHVKGSTIDTGETLTEQAHKKITDMNYILRDYAKTGLMKHVKKHEGTYDDISVTDFQEAMFKVTSAQNMFNELPSAIKKRFGNDPAEFLGFVQDSNNLDEMAKLGILRGNDGIDVSGASVKVPTQSDYEAVKAENLAAENAAKTETV